MIEADVIKEAHLIIAEWDKDDYKLINNTIDFPKRLLLATCDTPNEVDNRNSIIKELLIHKVIKLPCLIRIDGSLEYDIKVNAAVSSDTKTIKELFSQALVHYESMQLGLALSM